jgi:hypothetical protein
MENLVKERLFVLCTDGSEKSKTAFDVGKLSSSSWLKNSTTRMTSSR